MLPPSRCDFAVVEDLTVVVREHGPETSDGRWGDPKAQLSDIALDKSPDEPSAPFVAVGFFCGQERTWKTTPQPEEVSLLTLEIIIGK